MEVQVKDLTPDQFYYYIMDISSDLPKRMQDTILRNLEKTLMLTGGVLDNEVHINWQVP